MYMQIVIHFFRPGLLLLARGLLLLPYQHHCNFRRAATLHRRRINSNKGREMTDKPRLQPQLILE